MKSSLIYKKHLYRTSSVLSLPSFRENDHFAKLFLQSLKLLLMGHFKVLICLVFAICIVFPSPINGQASTTSTTVSTTATTTTPPTGCKTEEENNPPLTGCQEICGDDIRAAYDHYCADKRKRSGSKVMFKFWIKSNDDNSNR